MTGRRSTIRRPVQKIQKRWWRRRFLEYLSHNLSDMTSFEQKQLFLSLLQYLLLVPFLGPFCRRRRNPPFLPPSPCLTHLDCSRSLPPLALFFSLLLGLAGLVTKGSFALSGERRDCTVPQYTLRKEGKEGNFSLLTRFLYPRAIASSYPTPLFSTLRRVFLLPPFHFLSSYPSYLISHLAHPSLSSHPLFFATPVSQVVSEKTSFLPFPFPFSFPPSPSGLLERTRRKEEEEKKRRKAEGEETFHSGANERKEKRQPRQSPR